MKKTYFLLVTILLFLSNEISIAQQVEKNLVVVEIATGTWCVFCPGSALGADDLIENGHNVAIIENHFQDAYANDGSNSRNSLYGVTGYPTANFNGGDPEAGGHPNESIYGTYLPKVENALTVMSDFNLDLSYTRTGLDYEVIIDLDEVGDYTGTDLKVHLVLTESRLEDTWFGLETLNFVSRAMYPDLNGTPYTGDATTLTLNFTADPSWHIASTELVAFIQDNATKEILQANKVSLFEEQGTNNAETFSLSEFPNTCADTVLPVLKVNNLGSDEITSLAIDYSINSGATTGTYNWTGSFSPNELEEIVFDPISFSLEDTNSIEFNISEVNGTTDDDSTNNQKNDTFDRAPTTSSNVVYLELNTDNFGDECTWNIKDGNGTLILNGGPYANNTTINETLSDLEFLECYTFNLIDAYGDGGGIVTLKDSQDNMIYETDGTYAYGESQQFKSNNVLGTDNDVLTEVSIYPNPAKNQFTITNATGFNVSVYSILGKKVLMKDDISSNETIDTNSLTEGTYFVKIASENTSKTEKLVIIK